MYESCSNKVAKMLYKKVHRAEEVKDLDFYIFSYYYDCAAEAGLIGMSAPEFVSFNMASYGSSWEHLHTSRCFAKLLWNLVCC